MLAWNVGCAVVWGICKPHIHDEPKNQGSNISDRLGRFMRCVLLVWGVFDTPGPAVSLLEKAEGGDVIFQLCALISER